MSPHAARDESTEGRDLGSADRYLRGLPGAWILRGLLRLPNQGVIGSMLILGHHPEAVPLRAAGFRLPQSPGRLVPRLKGFDGLRVVSSHCWPLLAPVPAPIRMPRASRRACELAILARICHRRQPLDRGALRRSGPFLFLDVLDRLASPCRALPDRAFVAGDREHFVADRVNLVRQAMECFR